MSRNFFFDRFTPEDTEQVAGAFDREVLARVCAMHETEFGDAYGMTRTQVAWQKAPSDFYYFKDNGSKVLAVAHLDTVMPHERRAANFLDTAAGPVVYSGALDDRLGAYIILELLPALGITYDILLTVGEEDGQSTAAFFEAPEGKVYDRMIEFDRGGTDVVFYQYEDDDLIERVKNSGARVGDGIFSDICYLEHLGSKGINWGVGYQDYHGPRSHAYLEDTFSMVTKYLRFHEQVEGIAFPHEERDPFWGKTRYLDDDDYWRADDDDREKCDAIFGVNHHHDFEECEYALGEMTDTGDNERPTTALWTA